MWNARRESASVRPAAIGSGRVPVDPRISPVQFQAEEFPFHERVEDVLAQFALDAAEALYLAGLQPQAWHFQILGANAFQYVLIDQRAHHAVVECAVVCRFSLWLMIRTPLPLRGSLPAIPECRVWPRV